MNVPSKRCESAEPSGSELGLGRHVEVATRFSTDAQRSFRERRVLSTVVELRAAGDA